MELTEQPYWFPRVRPQRLTTHYPILRPGPPPIPAAHPGPARPGSAQPAGTRNPGAPPCARRRVVAVGRAGAARLRHRPVEVRHSTSPASRRPLVGGTPLARACPARPHAARHHRPAGSGEAGVRVPRAWARSALLSRSRARRWLRSCGSPSTPPADRAGDLADPSFCPPKVAIRRRSRAERCQVDRLLAPPVVALREPRRPSVMTRRGRSSRSSHIGEQKRDKLGYGLPDGIVHRHFVSGCVAVTPQ